MGGAIFSIFFVYWEYKSAFFLMGMAAVFSSALTYLLDTQAIARMQDALTMEVEQLLPGVADDSKEMEYDDEDAPPSSKPDGHAKDAKCDPTVDLSA